MINPIYEAAEYYVELQLPILPLCNPEHRGMALKHIEKCKSPGKVPLIYWQKHTNTTRELLNRWMKTYEDINLGLKLGRTKYWNLLGVDIDGFYGEQMWQQIIKDKDAPETWEFVTGGGGRRLIYYLPLDLETKKHRVHMKEGHEELAFLVEGQQTVIPPSIHLNGEVYAWVKDRSVIDIDIAPAPQWMIDLVKKKRETQYTDSVPVTSMDNQATITTGNRSIWLTRLAGHYCSRLNTSEEMVYYMVRLQNQTHCKPPLSDEEIRAMVTSVWSSEQQKKQRLEDQRRKRATLSPPSLAEMFLDSQLKMGYHYLYSVERDIMYSTDISRGPWKKVTKVALEHNITTFLSSLDPMLCKNHIIKEVIDALKRQLQAKGLGDQLDIGKYPLLDKIILNNGVFNWQNQELTQWDASIITTLQINATWNPQANTTFEYQLWQEALGAWLPEADSRAFIQEYIGYCLLPTCARRAAVFLLGGGANGKSLFIEVISALFEDSVAHVQPTTLTQRFGTTSLIDKTMVICSDIDNTYLTNTGTLKQLIAGDAIQAEYKGGKIFDFVPVARLLFSANELPKTSDKTHGWYSRMRIVRFPNRFKPNPQYKVTLTSRMSSEAGRAALLWWAVEGLVRLETNGDFTPAVSMDNELLQYKLENDSVLAFKTDQLIQLEELHEFYDRPESMIPIATLYTIYKDWCIELGHKSASKVTFCKKMTALGLVSKVKAIKKPGGRRTTTKCYTNVVWNKHSDFPGYEEASLHSRLSI